MKQLILICLVGLCANILNAQITILDEDVQERIVSKPKAFDSLSNLSYQKDPVQYKQYIGYKLYCLPISRKNISAALSVSSIQTELKSKESHEMVLPHPSYSETDQGKLFVYLATTKPNERQSGKIPDADISKLKGEVLKQYKEKEENYEKKFIVSTNIYKAVSMGSVSDLPRSDIQNSAKRDIYTPYDSIQNTYFTILDIEISRYKDKQFMPLQDWDNRHNGISYLRFTLKNETTGEELYWIHWNDRDISEQAMFLVPYFEKMQKLYKGHNVVPTKKIESLADVNTGEQVIIQPKEVWRCYDVTFVNLKDRKYIQPRILLEKNGTRVMIPFEDFTKKCRGIFTEEDNLFLPTFILEQEYNDIIAEKQRAEEERQRIAEEKQRQEELARQERNKQIMQKYGSKYGKLICEGKVCLKMTKEMCIEAWGEPNYINSTIVSGLVHEQWVYWGSYLYFDNGVLTGIQY